MAPVARLCNRSDFCESFRPPENLFWFVVPASAIPRTEATSKVALRRSTEEDYQKQVKDMSAEVKQSSVGSKVLKA